jgi:hypothetical protein
MVPHDQQVAVASPGITSDELVLDSRFAINTLATPPTPQEKMHLGGSLPQSLFASSAHSAFKSFSSTVTKRLLTAEVAKKAAEIAKNVQPENDVPQPQDFVEFGFTNTKPCCMSVS